MRSQRARLRAEVTPCDQPWDPVSFAGPDGLLLARTNGTLVATRGVVSKLSPTEAYEALKSIAVSGPSDLAGIGPLAVGAIDFDPSHETELTIPRELMFKHPNGTSWRTVLSNESEPSPLLEDHDFSAASIARTGKPGPTNFTVTSLTTADEWLAMIETAQQTMAAGPLEKVVLARQVKIEADSDFDIEQILHRLINTFPGCYVYSIDGLVGASPELLVERFNDQVRSQPMAGTAPRRGDPRADAAAVEELIADSSYRHEHQVTIDAVYDRLLPFCSWLDFEAEPSVVTLPNVTHLATSVQGQLSAPPAGALELVEALHPTPAVCGHPQALALEAIAQIETRDRGAYAGTVGWVDRHGNGEWAVTIRCAQIEGNVATVFGGNGIVATSDPTKELAETRAKLQAMLGVLVRP